ncbi:MAG: hypothetical protein KAS23_15110, partial [Anaerohalosphaera sp.]|nr:hypothetical protein [Anaerohalosphaera sp.]
MSSTLSSIQSSAMLALNRHASVMTKLQEQAATGSRINRPSDDSVGANQVLALRSTQNQLTNCIKNLNEAITTLGESSSATTDISGMLNEEVRVLLIQVTSGTYNDGNRDLIAGQINEILEQIVSRANSSHLDQYIFSGTTTKTQPYHVVSENGRITSVNYAGSQNDLSVRTSGGIETAACKSGDDVFKMNSRSAPEIVGSGGVSLGAGTSSVTGFTWLEVTHDAANGQYELTINGGVDSYVVPDDGTGSANLALTDSRTGRILYVDASQPISEGTTLVATPGTFDVFD